VYTPDGAPDPAWKPTIIEIPTDMTRGQTYTVMGTQLNGISQAVSYGDDAQMATNYPLVRIRSTTSGNVVYLKTFNHSTMGVATGTVEHTTTFFVPPGTATGTYGLVVVANGIASESVTINIIDG
jgi:hypothetical protein